MMYHGAVLITLDVARRDTSPLAQAYVRWWETPHPRRRHPALARLAVALVRFANRLAPVTDAAEPARAAMYEPSMAARAASQP